MAGWGGSFQYEESNSIVAEAMEEYVLDSVKAAYEDTEEQAPMGFMTAGGGFHDGNYLHWWDKITFISH